MGDLGLGIGPHQQLLRRYVRSMAVLLAPVGPHLAEQLWTLSGEAGFVVNARWPADVPSNSSLLSRMENYFEGKISSLFIHFF